MIQDINNNITGLALTDGIIFFWLIVLTAVAIKHEVDVWKQNHKK
jgi:uncharacterized phage infection (PIP) family protein YhgE